MIKGFRNKLRLFNNEPKTETNQLFAENPDKNGFHFKVIETQYSSVGGLSATDRLTDQEAKLLEKIMVVNRRDEKKLKKNEIKKTDTETVVAVVESVYNNSDNSDVNNREVIDSSSNTKNLDQDADTVTNSNNSNQQHLDGGSERAKTASSNHGSVKDLPIAESEVDEKKNINNDDDSKIKSSNASIVTDSESILNEATDKITSIPIVEGSGYPEDGSFKDSPRRSYSQRENRIINPRLRKLSVPAVMEHDGPQSMGNR